MNANKRERLLRGVPKDFKKHVKAAVDRGWTLSATRRGHPKLTAPDGRHAIPIPGSKGHNGLLPAWLNRLEKLEAESSR